MSTGLFTIGCSTHSLEGFIALLQKHNIKAIADVRSTPFSRFTPQFNAPSLKAALVASGLFYIPMGEEFGARRKETKAYRDGRVDFDLVKALPLFLKGIERIRAGNERGVRTALMCTEKDPIDCHRFVLVSRNIERSLDLGVDHILSNGAIEKTTSLEDRLIKKAGLQIDMFNPAREPLINQAYSIVGSQIAYSEETEGAGHD
jgi:uncharacterized protein (DUF488 family)